MTVRDLFESVGFDAVVNVLQNTYRNEKSVRWTALYKEAFDELVKLEFAGEGAR
ncbi:hypothetical protein [uncultured Rikenella sp.]|uniref:hypothetical protein n=1 Tax=uncultured Rikenella sp. TaxID=368003 RepID=UPI002613BA33|nr:hypothetical protein [uncultured Rikenella sp.]